MRSDGYKYKDYGKFRLHCNNSQVIHVVNARVGTSNCRNEERCCPSSSDNTVEGTPDIVQNMKDICDGWHNCDLKTPDLENADYLSVNYICSNYTASKL